MGSSQSSNDEWTNRLRKKENIKSEGFQDANGHQVGGQAAFQANFLKLYPNHGLPANKARSSLASSGYQANGQMPQYDGASDALTATRGEGSGATSRATPSRENIASTGPTRDLIGPGCMTRRDRAIAYDKPPTADFDTRGLTRGAFNNIVDRPADPAQRDRANDFFHRLREEEKREILAWEADDE